MDRHTFTARSLARSGGRRAYRFLVNRELSLKTIANVCTSYLIDFYQKCTRIVKLLVVDLEDFHWLYLVIHDAVP